MAQVPVERHEYARRTKPALQGVMSTERVLQDGQTPRLRFEALDRTELRSVGLNRQRQARARQRALDFDRAAAADSVFATDMAARHAALVTQKIREQPARLGFAL